MADEPATEPWLTPEEARDYIAEHYRVDYHLTHLHRKAAAGEIPSYKVGGHRRFVRSELDAWARGDWTPAGTAA